MVITKDLSRLGRDYIKTGFYIEDYFPKNNVRYVAITDGIDTYLESNNNDITPFKAIMNDMYAKDISKKIRSVYKEKQKQDAIDYGVSQRNKSFIWGSIIAIFVVQLLMGIKNILV